MCESRAIWTLSTGSIPAAAGIQATFQTQTSRIANHANEEFDRTGTQANWEKITPGALNRKFATMTL
jgi:hypothetical protein